MPYPSVKLLNPFYGNQSHHGSRHTWAPRHTHRRHRCYNRSRTLLSPQSSTPSCNIHRKHPNSLVTSRRNRPTTEPHSWRRNHTFLLDASIRRIQHKSIFHDRPKWKKLGMIFVFCVFGFLCFTRRCRSPRPARSSQGRPAPRRRSR